MGIGHRVVIGGDCFASHTPSHTSLITSELITAPLLTPDITSPLLTPHFSHLPEVHIKILHT